MSRDKYIFLSECDSEFTVNEEMLSEFIGELKFLSRDPFCTSLEYAEYISQLLITYGLG